VATSEDVMRILAGRRQRTGRVAVAASVLAIDVANVLYAGALMVAASVSAHPQPSAQLVAVALAIAVLGGGAAASVWLCSQFRGFRFVMAVTLAWTAAWTAAMWQTIDPGFPVGYTLGILGLHVWAATLLWSGRRAFAPIPS
jgi:hypothetical protein